MKSALVLLAPGFEEIEAIAPIDILRRAGVAVTTVAVGSSLEVVGGHDITVKADKLLSDHRTSADLVVVPGGGGGSKAIAASPEAAELILRHARAEALVAAICAAPAVVLHPLGLLKGKAFTCYPGMEARVEGARFSADRVVVDSRLITSRGAGTANEFALALVAALVGTVKAAELKDAILQS
jgi:4-methyl-5(b-hydroxyethyl)-thiazole monophosphate biosynthesis